MNLKIVLALALKLKLNFLPSQLYLNESIVAKKSAAVPDKAPKETPLMKQ